MNVTKVLRLAAVGGLLMLAAPVERDADRLGQLQRGRRAG